MPDDPLSHEDDTDVDSLDASVPANFISLRNYAKKLEKELKAERGKGKEMETKLQTFEQTAREMTVKDAAREAGLTAKNLEDLFKLRPDADVEAVATYAEALGIVKPEAPADGEPAPEGEPAAPAPAAAFVPAPGSSLPAKAITSEDLKAALLRGDDAFLQRAAAEASRDPSRLALKHEALIGE